MAEALRAIETAGRVVDARHIETDTQLPVGARVRVLVLLPNDSDDLAEHDWLAAAARNPAFAFLADPVEDIYTLEDGEPFGPS